MHPQTASLHYIRGLFVGISLSVLATVLSTLGFFRSFENTVFDFLIWWEQDKRSAFVLLVDIDDRDYRDLFHSTSPLSREKISEIILKIARAKPRAIGIDVDLSDPTPEDHFLLDALERLNVQKIPVIIPLSFDMQSGAEGREKLNSSGPLASRLPENVLAGVAEFPIYKDGVIREMQLTVKSHSGEIYPSVPLAAIAASEGYQQGALSEALGQFAEGHSSSEESPSKTRELLMDARHNSLQKIQYIGDKRSFAVLRSSVLDSTPDKYFRPGSIFSDKIIVVGGTFKISRDFYATPKGAMSGVEIVANSIDTLLNAKRVKPLNHVLELMFEIIMVLVMTGIFVKLEPLKATVVSLVSIAPLSLAGSAFAFTRLSCWVNFIPTAVSIFIHGEISFFEHYAHLKAEVKSLALALAGKDRELSAVQEKVHVRDETEAVQIREEGS